MLPLLHPAWPLLLGATLTFRALRRALCRLPLPAHVRTDPLRTWRWRNLLVSFTHSIVSGIWALLWVFHSRHGGHRDQSSGQSFLGIPRSPCHGHGCLLLRHLLEEVCWWRCPDTTGGSEQHLPHHAYDDENQQCPGFPSLPGQQYAGQRTLGTFLLAILLMLDVMILIYFSRLLRSDFCPDRVPSQQHKDKFLTE